MNSESRVVSATLDKVPTDAPEADGTFAWKSTSMVELQSGEVKALGNSYADAGAAAVADKLRKEVALTSDALRRTRQRLHGA